METTSSSRKAGIAYKLTLPGFGKEPINKQELMRSDDMLVQPAAAIRHGLALWRPSDKAGAAVLEYRQGVWHLTAVL